VVVASGGYARRLHPRVDRSVQPVATYIVVTEPLGTRLDACLPSDHAIYDTRFAFDYYRRLPGGRLLWGGRISTADRDPGSVKTLMRRDLARVFPTLADCRLDYAWGGWMSYARHQMPVLGEVEPGLWLALGFGGHGMAPTALAGELLAEAIAGDETRLRMFRRFAPVWAGGTMGRAAVQAVYWWKQLRDRMR
jgi:glycine/D-amino acid oxidase-like deaminating enzyme